MPSSVVARPSVVTDNALIRHKIAEGVFSNAPYTIDWKVFQEAVNQINKLKEESNANRSD